MRAPTSDPAQNGLFLEIIETRRTRDELVDDADGGWHSRVCPPPGAGWKVIDFSHDKWTRWQRYFAPGQMEVLKAAEESEQELISHVVTGAIRP
jgi:hypothetical protein